MVNTILQDKFLSYCESLIKKEDFKALYSETHDSKTYRPELLEELICATIYRIKIIGKDHCTPEDYQLLNHDLIQLKDEDSSITIINLLNIIVDLEVINIKLDKYKSPNASFRHLYS